LYIQYLIAGGDSYAAILNYPRAIMAPRQSTTTKTAANGKKPASRRSLLTPTKAKVNRPGRKPRAVAEPAAVAPKATSSKGDGDLSSLLKELTSQMVVQQQAIATQAWMTTEIATLRSQLKSPGAVGRPGKIAASGDSAVLTAKVAKLEAENADLRAKAAKLDKMSSLLGLSDAVEAKPKGKPGRPAKATKEVTPRVPKAARAPKAVAPVKVPGKRGPKPKVVVAPVAISVGRGSKASLLKAAAEKDVARTFKSCWPVVFKIEEWNAKNPTRLAKISQTMLNKCGVNFARAKQFVETYEAIVQRYHDEIGLNKANSGKFNEVYEFVRDSLGKGRRR
jgi:hypothetical protein